jgi:hypothetical protein
MATQTDDDVIEADMHPDDSNGWTWLGQDQEIPLKVRLAGTDLVRRIPFQHVKSADELEEVHRIIKNRFVLEDEIIISYINEEDMLVRIDSNEVWEKLVENILTQRQPSYVAINIQVSKKTFIN